MAKAVAVPYLLAIIIMVIVLAIIGYWFVNKYLKTSDVVSEAFCRGRILQFCSDLTAGRISSTTDFYNDYAKDCGTYRGKPGWDATSPDLERCKTITGI